MKFHVASVTEAQKVVVSVAPSVCQWNDVMNFCGSHKSSITLADLAERKVHHVFLSDPCPFITRIDLLCLSVAVMLVILFHHQP